MCMSDPLHPQGRELLPPTVLPVGAQDWDPDDQPVPDWLTQLPPPLVLVARSTVYQRTATSSRPLSTPWPTARYP